MQVYLIHAVMLLAVFAGLVVATDDKALTPNTQAII
jgi:hypothetical protein